MAVLQCDICGGNLAMDSGGEFATCESCGIKHDKRRMQQKVQEITGTVKINGLVQVKDADFIIRAGRLEKYSGAATDVVIPSNITIIGQQAFSNCVGLKSIAIPESVTVVENDAFSGCSGITNISIPDSIKRIPSGIFAGCNNIQNIKIPCGLNTSYTVGFYSMGDIDEKTYHFTIPNDFYSSSLGELCGVVTSLFYKYFSNSHNSEPIGTYMYKWYFGKYPTNLFGVSHNLQINEIRIIELIKKRIFDEESQRKEWQSRGLCRFCGGKISIFGSKCKSCGRSV